MQKVTEQYSCHQTLIVVVRWKFCFSNKILDWNLCKRIARWFLVRRVIASTWENAFLKFEMARSWEGYECLFDLLQYYIASQRLDFIACITEAKVFPENSKVRCKLMTNCVWTMFVLLNRYFSSKFLEVLPDRLLANQRNLIWL